MCLIVDTCRLDSFFPDPKKKHSANADKPDEAKPLRDLVWAGKLMVVYSTHDRFRSEFNKKDRALRQLAAWVWDKKARRVEAPQLEAKMGDLPSQLESDQKKNDDRHILALALASGARLLYTKDGPLAKDFTDPGVIKKPRGKVYLSHEKHANLLHPHTLRKLCRAQRERRR